MHFLDADQIKILQEFIAQNANFSCILIKTKDNFSSSENLELLKNISN
jgi:hypothetical protein